MDAASFISRIRDHYVDQFRSFADRQKQDCTKGAAEVKLKLSDESKLFEHLYCADFIGNEPPEIIELLPENILTFEPIDGAFGDAALSIESLSWDDVLVRHDGNDLPLPDVSRWFRQWFDPEDERYDQAADFSHVVHSLLVEPGMVTIDFGTAEPEAFWDMLDLIEGAGATTIRVSSSRTDATDDDEPVDWR